MKDIYIADVAGFDEQKIFDAFFLLLSKQTRSTRTNKPYLSLIFSDKTGQLESARVGTRRSAHRAGLSSGATW